MSTDVDQAYFTWSQEQLTQRDGSTGVSVSQMLDHGSVSFGKFEFESLSWEKWSVFTHDRRQEELEKFNGLVAEKKAYFEEYYKKLRALKALQQQQEQEQQEKIRRENQTELNLEYSIDGSISEEEDEKLQQTKLEIKDERENQIKEERENQIKEEREGNVVNKKDDDFESNKPMEPKTITKGASSSNSTQQPKKTLKPKTKPETRPVSRNSRQITRPVSQKAIKPPPPPPIQKVVRKVNSPNPKVNPKEPSRTTFPSISTSTSSANLKRPSSSGPTITVLKKVNPTKVNPTNVKVNPREASRTTTTPSISRNTNIDASNMNLKRPSSSGGLMKRPMSSGGARPNGPASRRPISSNGNREKFSLKSDLRSTRAGVPSLLNTPRIAIIPSTVKSNTIETKREIRKIVKEPLALNNNTTSVKRAQVYSLETSKSRSINLPPKKNSDSSKVGLNKETKQTSTNVLRNNTHPARINASIRNTNTKLESHKPIAPRTSERPNTGTRPGTSKSGTSNSSLNARKPRAEAQKWR